MRSINGMPSGDLAGTPCKGARAAALIECGDAILVAGYAGLLGTAIIAEQKAEVLKKRYRASFVKAAADCFVQAAPLPDFLWDAEVSLLSATAEEGGVYRALWTLMEPLPFGFTVELLDIPLRTETIELCNTFDLNPYELLSGKCMALICRRPQQTLRRLQEAGCIAAIVGEITEGNEKRVNYKGGSLHLRPSDQDAIERIIEREGLEHGIEREDINIY